MLPVADLSVFPAPLRTLIQSGQDRFISLDRGSIRARNDNTTDARAAFFVAWLRDNSVDAALLASLSSAQLEVLIGAFTEHTLHTGGISGRGNLSVATVAGYLQAVSLSLRVTFGLSHPCLLDGSLARLDYVGALLAQRRTWQQPRDKKEPFSSELLASLHSMASKAEHDAPGRGFLGLFSCLFDCIRLTVFTGSRLGEYGQSNIRREAGAVAFNAVPDTPDVPLAFRGLPLAFIRGDFEFFDAGDRLLVQDDVLKAPSLAQRLRVRFRYDKGPDNFTFRKYVRSGHSFLCPVLAAISLLLRARRIHHNFTRGAEPLAMFLNGAGQQWTLRGSHISPILRQACERAHPDPNHYLRVHIHCLMAHCGRVTAAVALFNAGVPIDVIAFRLRWKSSAVLAYLRDCWRSTGDMTMLALRGAFDDSGFDPTRPPDYPPIP
jgi:hypothetical protein